MKVLRVLGTIALALGLVVAASERSHASRRLNGGNAACGGQRVRKSWDAMSANERGLYVEALRSAFARGIVRDFANIHLEDRGEYQAHHSCAFFTWHRRLLLAFESALRDQDPRFACVTLPYYDVHTAYVQAANGRCSNMYECSGIFAGIGGQPSQQQRTLTLGGRQASGLAYAGAPFDALCDDNDQCGAMVRNDLTDRPVPSGAGFGAFQNLVARSTDYATFLEGVQFGLHNEIHNALGGCMATFASPMDVFFYSWHAAIDMYLHVFHSCHFGEPLTDSELHTSLKAFVQATQQCGGVSGVDANSEIIMYVRYNGQTIDASEHPTLGRYFAHVGDQMWRYGDIQRLGDYSYSYQVPDVFGRELLSNTDICRGIRQPQPENTTTTAAPGSSSSSGSGHAGSTNGSTSVTVSLDDSSDDSSAVDTVDDSSSNGQGKHKHAGKGQGKKIGHHKQRPVGNSTSGKKPKKPSKKDKTTKGAGNKGPHHGIVLANDTNAAASGLDGEYFVWLKTTYDGLMTRFDGNVELVAQQLHVAECLAFDRVFGVRDFSDDFAANFHLTSKRPVCGKRVDQVQAGEVVVAVTTTEFVAQTVEFKGEDVVQKVVETYKPLAPSAMPLIDPKIAKKAEEEIKKYQPHHQQHKNHTTPAPTPASSKPVHRDQC